MLVTFSSIGCSGQRVLLFAVLGAALFCYVFVSLVDRWAARPPAVKGPHYIADIHTRYASKDTRKSKKSFKDTNWENEYSRRVERVRDVCEHDEMAMMRRIWRVAANRRFGKKAFCKTRMCPIIVDEKKVLFFCFIPKIASTRIKQFFLEISGLSINDTLKRNDTALHLVANSHLHRVSPMYYPASTARRFYKIMFVRHPFDRLVSVFRNKAEVPRSEALYFYDAYWDKIMGKLRPNETLDDSSRLTFPEFVWYLVHSLEKDYDEHWAPYWRRCDPCLVDYDFIGKFETAATDFQYAFDKVGIESPPGYWSSAKPTDRSVALKYFSKIPEKDIVELYRIFKLDFDLFNYTLDGFVSPKENMIVT